jgi:DNA topoisomerase IA
MGVDPWHDWNAHYEVLPGKEKVVSELNLIEHHAAVTLFIAADNFPQVPGNGFPFAVKVGCGMGVDPWHDWNAHYEVLPGKEKVVSELKQLAEKADQLNTTRL